MLAISFAIRLSQEARTGLGGAGRRIFIIKHHSVVSLSNFVVFMTERRELDVKWERGSGDVEVGNGGAPAMSMMEMPTTEIERR